MHYAPTNFPSISQVAETNSLEKASESAPLSYHTSAWGLQITKSAPAFGFPKSIASCGGCPDIIKGLRISGMSDGVLFAGALFWNHPGLARAISGALIASLPDCIQTVKRPGIFHPRVLKNKQCHFQGHSNISVSLYLWTILHPLWNAGMLFKLLVSYTCHA